jgi:hypothetical protein
MDLNSIPRLGVGIGFREPFRAELFLNKDKVDFLEITADHYLNATKEKERELELLQNNFTLIPHALNLSLGSAEGIDESYLEKLARLIESVKPPYWSEHICFTKAGGIQIGHLAALPFTNEAIDVLSRNIEKVKKRITVPLVLENITYTMKFPFGEMDEAEFISQVITKNDCGLLLDVTNLYINSVNHKYDWREYLNRLPLERVVQLHFVGGHEHKHLLIDSHSQTTPNEIWEVMEEVLKRAPVKAAILERDENFPSFDELIKELDTAREIGRRFQRWD